MTKVEIIKKFYVKNHALNLFNIKRIKINVLCILYKMFYIYFNVKYFTFTTLTHH